MVQSGSFDSILVVSLKKSCRGHSRLDKHGMILSLKVNKILNNNTETEKFTKRAQLLMFVTLYIVMTRNEFRTTNDHSRSLAAKEVISRDVETVFQLIPVLLINTRFFCGFANVYSSHFMAVNNKQLPLQNQLQTWLSFDENG